MSQEHYDKIIIGIDPGTHLTGYGILGIQGKKCLPLALGIIHLNKFDDHYIRLYRIYERVLSLVEHYKPDEMAIEAPFFGKNVQSMLKLGRAQGVAIAAALTRQVPITEYEPRKVKLAITGSGAASKEQVREMLKRILHIPQANLDIELDATDALAVALCHHYTSMKPDTPKGGNDWKQFIAKNPDRVHKP